MPGISLNVAHWGGYTRWVLVRCTMRRSFKFDPHLFVLPALIPSHARILGYRWWGVMWSPLLVTQSFRHMVNILYPKQPYTHPTLLFNLLSSCIILISPSLYILNCSAVTTPCRICLSIFLSFSAVTLFSQTRSLVKGLHCNCTKAPACWNTVAPLAAVLWFIWLKTFYSLSKWLREPLGPYRIECVWQRNVRFSVHVLLRL